MVVCSSWCLNLLLNALVCVMKFTITSQSNVQFQNDRVYRYVGSDHLTEPLNNDLSLGKTSDQFQEIPESILIKLKDITNVSEFIDHFLKSPENNENNQNNNSVYLEYLHSGFDSNLNFDMNLLRSKLKKLPKISNPAGCNLEMKIIELQIHKEYNEIYFPSCVRVPRCSGCCSSKRLLCKPLKKSFDDISVLRVKYSHFEKRFVFQGFKVFRIEKHDSCACDCIQKTLDCSVGQVYVPEECRCKCKRSDLAKKCELQFNMYWDNNDCQCKCSKSMLCSTGFKFNNETCGCEMTDWAKKSLSSLNNTVNFYLAKSQSDDREIQSNEGMKVYQYEGINPEVYNHH